MKKSAVFCVILMMISALSSCGLFGDNPTEDPKTPVTTGYKYIVTNDESADLTELRAAILDKKGPIGVMTDAEPVGTGEIVIGDTNRDVTARAKAELNALIAGDGDAEIGYIIYAYAGSVALYWTTDGMSTIALADFVDIFVEEKNMSVTDGVLHSVLFDEGEYLSESEWLALKAVCEPNVYTALRRLSSYYEPDRLVGWMANLWDDEIGGFYFSISARDNEPYLPDIESTSQAINWLYNNKFITDYNEVPNDIKIKMVDFAISLQSSNDGYFYHPQWGQSREQLNIDRYARDLGWATGIITRYDVDRDGDGVLEQQYPNYCAPDGTKCELHTGTDERCSFTSLSSSVDFESDKATTATVVSTVSSAVSRMSSSTVKATAVTGTRPDYSSAEAFRNWLYATNDMGATSGNAQVINALRGEIVANGYCEVLLDFLDEKQQEIYDLQLNDGEEPTGLWTYKYDYGAVWGLLKYTPFYNDSVYGRQLKYAEEIVNTCMEVIMLEPDGKYQANDIYNMWQGMQALFNNLQKYEPETRLALQAKLRERGAELINNSISKIEWFKRTDGAFSMYSDGISQATIYGAPIAMCVEEGDVNSTGLICSMYRCMFSCLGFNVVQLGNASRAETFFKLLSEVEPIEKNPAPKPSTITFEDGETVVSMDNMSGKASVTIVDDNDLESGNSVLQYSSFDASATSDFGDGITFTIGGISGDNCSVFETDIMVKSATISDIMQIRFGNFYRLRIHQSGNSLKLTEILEVSGAVSPSSVTLGKIGEWHRLRIECYKSDEDYDAPRFKIFIDDECVLISGGTYGVNSTVREQCTTLLLRSYKSAESVILFDNVFCYTQHKQYNESLDDISDARDTVQ